MKNMWPFQALNYGFLAPLYKVQMLDFLEPQCHLACATSGVSCKLEYLVCTYLDFISLSAQPTCYIYITIFIYIYIIFMIHVYMILYMYTSACQPVFIRLTQVLPLIFFHAKVEVWMDHMKWHPAREVNDWSSPTPCEELLKICGILIHAKLPKPKKNWKKIYGWLILILYG